MNVWCSSLVHRPEERARDGGREGRKEGRGREIQVVGVVYIDSVSLCYFEVEVMAMEVKATRKPSTRQHEY